jgi:hypothetical protein
MTGKTIKLLCYQEREWFFHNRLEPAQEGPGLLARSSGCLLRLTVVERVEYQQSAAQITAGTCIK